MILKDYSKVKTEAESTSSDNTKENEVLEKDVEDSAPKKESAVVVAKTEEEWARLIHTQGLLVVDVYSSWCGHCAAMEHHLKKLKIQHMISSDQVTLARACCDRIEELAPFRSDARPTWLFLSSGVPTALLRGMNRPLLTKLFQSEILMEREPRMPVMINYRSPAVIQCAGHLASLATDQVVHSIGSGRTEMLTKMFQDAGSRIILEQKYQSGEQKSSSFPAVVKQTLQEYKEVKKPDDKNDSDESNLVQGQGSNMRDQINLASSLNDVGGLVYDELGEGEEEGMDDINDDVSTQETICPEDGEDRKNTEVRKPRRNRELRAGLLKEILLNRGNKRATFSGLFM